MEQYLCHAIGCNVRVLPSRLMCSPHWAMVPKSLQTAVWKAYRPGQALDGLPPSREYLDAARAAVNVVARLEGQTELPANVNPVKTIERQLAAEKLAKESKWKR